MSNRAAASWISADQVAAALPAAPAPAKRGPPAALPASGRAGPAGGEVAVVGPVDPGAAAVPFFPIAAAIATVAATAATAVETAIAPAGARARAAVPPGAIR